LTLLLVPMDVRIPRAGPLAMAVCLTIFAAAVGDGTVSRFDGAVLALAGLGLLVWLYRRSPVFQRTEDEDEDDEAANEARASRARAVAPLVIGVVVMLLGAELMVRGVRGLLSSAGLSETFLGMAVIGMGESLEEMARMVVPARRGHPELAWGNVVGTVVILLALNLGLVAMIHPLTADPIVVRLHVPFLAGCIVIVASVLLWTHRVGWGIGGLLVALYAIYLGLNIRHMWR